MLTSVLPHMSGKLKHVFGDFLRSARKLWLEMMGALFLALAVMFALNMISEYRRTLEPVANWDWRTSFSVFGSGVFSLVTLLFGLQSFWKSRKLP
jgi:hypothetical protein